MNIEFIWAQDENGGIGKNGKLPWNISEDLRNFKKITSGFPIIMGRKTWDSLPFKPLPKRRNIVLSTKTLNDVENYSSVESCIKSLKNSSVKRVFIIGGESVYKEFYYKASILHLTVISDKVNGINVFFPISINSIKEKYNMIESYNLSEKATYTKWVLKT
tara:strand:+ start:111 stop:593 length:483 start_codon:yes stop_codon:yes gene_type:complete